MSTPTAAGPDPEPLPEEPRLGPRRVRATPQRTPITTANGRLVFAVPAEHPGGAGGPRTRRSASRPAGPRPPEGRPTPASMPSQRPATGS